MRATGTAGGALAAGGALVFVGLLGADPGVTALGAAILVATAVALLHARAGAARAALTASITPAVASPQESAPVAVLLEVSAAVDLAPVLVTVGRVGLGAGQRSATIGLAVRSDQPARTQTLFVPHRWGRAELGPLRITASLPGGLAELSGSDATVHRLLVRPQVPRVRPTDAMPQARTASGVHRAREAGVGVVLRGLRPFQSGDPLRQVNWRAVARGHGLHAKLTDTERGSHVVIVIDVGHDISSDPLWAAALDGGVAGRGGSSLDLAVRAAAGLAEHFLSVGDLVALMEVGGIRRVRPARGGRSELGAIRDWLARCRDYPYPPTVTTGWPLPVAAGSALTIALSPLLDATTLGTLIEMRRRGAHLVVLDTLPAEPLPAPTSATEVIAQRLWRAERAGQQARLSELGILVVPWEESTGTGQLDTVLAQLAQLAARPRAALR